MNFCQPHWDLLREKIRAAGLSSLISDDGAEAMGKMVKQIKGEEEAHRSNNRGAPGKTRR